MPFKFLIDRNRRLVTTVATGEVTLVEAKAYQDQIRNNVDFDPLFDQFIDLSDVTEIAMLSDELLSLAERNPLSCTSRIALVAPKALTFGISRMLQAFNEFSAAASSMAVFYDFPSAMRFLAMNEEE